VAKGMIDIQYLCNIFLVLLQENQNLFAHQFFQNFITEFVLLTCVTYFGIADFKKAKK
jgi:hypothetical protein